MINTSRNLNGIKAVVFDVFGPLAHMGEKRHPYSQLLQKLCERGHRPQADDAARIMSANVGLAGIAGLFNVDLPAAELAEIEMDLYAELATFELFPDVFVLPTLKALREAGFKLALCSNLAAPYAIPVKLLLPPLDSYVWSFEAGAVKPEQAIYEALLERLDCSPHEILMLGDTLESDCTAPRRHGVQGFHLLREGESPVAECVRTLYEVLDLLGCAIHRTLQNERQTEDV